MPASHSSLPAGDCRQAIHYEKQKATPSKTWNLYPTPEFVWWDERSQSSSSQCIWRSEFRGVYRFSTCAAVQPPDISRTCKVCCR